MNAPTRLVVVWMLCTACGSELPVDLRPGEGTERPPGTPKVNDPGGPLQPLPIPLAPVVPQVEVPWALPALQTDMPEYRINMPKATYDLFMRDIWAPEQPAQFSSGGVTLPVKVELRGASSRVFPKKSWNLDFEELRFDGRRHFNLIAQYQDNTMMAEKLAYDLLEAMGVKASRGKYVRVYVNDVYQGVFLDLEQVDKRFLASHRFADDDATIYRCGWKDCEFKTWKVDYQGDWQKKTNELEGDEPLIDMLRAINHTPEPQLVATLNQRMELEQFLRTLVVDALMGNNFVEDSESYFIHDRVTNRWSYVPWDLNNADARWWTTVGIKGYPKPSKALLVFSATDVDTAKRYEDRRGMYPGYLPVFSNLNTRVALNPDLRGRYLALLERSLMELFTPEKLHARIDDIVALIAPHMADDPYIDQAKFAKAGWWMKEWVSNRLPVLRSEMARLAALPEGLMLAGFDPQEGWVELTNRGALPVDLRGHVLTTNLRDPWGSNLPSRSLAPGERLRLTAAQLGVTFAPEGELGLYGPEGIAGMRDALFYGKLPASQRYQRLPDGRWAAE